VNMVWVLARTTVKASAQAAAIDPAPVRLAPAPRPAGLTPKPDSPSTSIAPASSTA